MNTNNQQPSKPNYDDEVTLVDVATTLIRRRYVFYSVFIAVVVLVSVYAFLMTKEVREYTTLVQLGEDENKPLESPQSVIANIESRWYPELLSEYRSEYENKLPFKINATNPENTSLIKLSTETSPELAQKVKHYHSSLVDRVSARETELIDRQKKTLEQRVATLRNYLEELSSTEARGEALAQLIQERGRMLSDIEYMSTRIINLKPSETLVIAREGFDNKGISKRIIVILAIVLGLMLGFFAAFIVEFGSKVHQAMKSQG